MMKDEKRTEDTPVSCLSGVGKVKAAAYERLGIKTLSDLACHYPRSYENRGEVCLLSEARADAKSAVILTVSTEPRRALIRRGMSLLKFRAVDESGTCEITYFNQDYLKDKFPIGSEFRFWGKVERMGKQYAMTAPVAEPYAEGVLLPPLVPVYPLTEGLSQKQISANVRDAILVMQGIADPLPDELRRQRSLCTRAYALRGIHTPEDPGALATAKKRLIYDEFLTFSLGMALSHEKTVRHGAPECKENDLSRLYGLLPFPLTGAQTRAIGEISREMATDVPMSRIVVGDVGCGKTVCALAAMVTALQSGHQAALMAPTEILARQHFADLAPYFESLGFRCALLIGATPEGEKRKIRAGLASTEKGTRIDTVIGTHALLTDSVKFSDPALVVTDEQHRFGVAQRAKLSEKGAFSHLLVMSATPIPRSLALVLYGDLAVSRIDEMPPGRQRVDTFFVDESYRERLFGFVRKQVREGGQVYVVCPAVEEAEKLPSDEIALDAFCDPETFGGVQEVYPPMKAAVNYAQTLAEQLPGITVGFLHGRIKSAEKDGVMAQFASGNLDVLVSTTVIEVGVNVPNASLMIVENADRFGLSQLHQLRGRVGRGKRKSYCILVSDTESDKARKRLETMHTVYDGFKIAEEDLAERGPGDFLGKGNDGIRQSGGLRFRLGELCTDTGLFTSAAEDARELIAGDPQLKEHPGLLSEVNRMFDPEEGLIS